MFTIKQKAEFEVDEEPRILQNYDWKLSNNQNDERSLASHGASSNSSFGKLKDIQEKMQQKQQTLAHKLNRGLLNKLAELKSKANEESEKAKQESASSSFRLPEIRRMNMVKM